MPLHTLEPVFEEARVSQRAGERGLIRLSAGLTLSALKARLAQGSKLAWRFECCAVRADQ